VVPKAIPGPSLLRVTQPAVPKHGAIQEVTNIPRAGLQEVGHLRVLPLRPGATLSVVSTPRAGHTEVIHPSLLDGTKEANTQSHGAILPAVSLPRLGHQKAGHQRAAHPRAGAILLVVSILRAGHMEVIHRSRQDGTREVNTRSPGVMLKAANPLRLGAILLADGLLKALRFQRSSRLLALLRLLRR
jgi:hypothetical protein